MFQSRPIRTKDDLTKLQDQYKRSRLHPRCCGCFPNWFGSLLGCLIMSGFSFYFGVLSFMQKSPFYSKLETAPLIVFGVVNILFGLITLFTFIMIVISHRVFDRHLVYVLGLSAAAVVLDTLSNFIYFVANQKTFQQWCISDGLAQIQSDSNMDAALPIVSDYYNCQRLFNDEVKWSLLCVILMFLLYTHWTVFIATFIGKVFIPMDPMLFVTDPIPSMEAIQPHMMANIPPHGEESVYHNLKPQAGATVSSDKVLITPFDQV
ncbi:hypothetical protein [Absidia glauca]|uniref:Uncharacterized protein n=1 Tax=Absidia glauca TaxID=4829 RepID=A0A163TES8_ABSGL|nr:hypothetical protein [Absidia glauca]